jgi:hypothetical protein
MNKGLPSLLDAIFGKNDLALVSLDEMYDVISEFPSFNAAHFLLSKKLKEKNDPAFEKQSMRTALYFNNALWLQTLLDEGNKVRTENAGVVVDSRPADHVNGHDKNDIESLAAPEIPQEIHVAEHPEDEIVVPDETTESYQSNSEPIRGIVTSFDELLLKYKIEPELSEEDVPKEEKAEYTEENTNLISGDKRIDIQDEEPVREFDGQHAAEHKEEIITFITENEIIHPAETAAHEEPLTDTNQEQVKTKHEILNEYGIIEEEADKANDPDLDFESFDRTVDRIETVSEPEEEIIQPDEIQIKEEIPIPPVTQTTAEIPFQKDVPEKSDVHEFEAFDRPLEKNSREQEDDDYVWDEEIREARDLITSETADLSYETSALHTDETESATPFNGGYEEEIRSPLPDAIENNREEQKKVPVFDPKRDESIVFAPYHMIDYFASQGIKLVLEDNPPDHFGQQLKSFTDWLKVMKKLPPNQQSVKTDEKEADRIRHFAAHSIEDRDVLTESMAEVLAKQGMYENAIALYQKLSLIYPPKSAYFASRIEQLKASLP